MKNKKKFLMTASATTGEHYTFSGVANTLSKSRSGVKILASAVENLKGVKRPLLYSHNWGGYPIGVATFGDVTEQGLNYDAQLFTAAENRELLLESLKNGALSVSVGFLGDTDDAGDVSSVDMLELSLTPTPADAGATAILQALDDDTNNDSTDGQDNQVPTDVAQAISDFGENLVKAIQDLTDVLTPENPEDTDKPAAKPEENDDETVQALLSMLEQKGLTIHDRLALRGITKKQGH